MAVLVSRLLALVTVGCSSSYIAEAKASLEATVGDLYVIAVVAEDVSSYFCLTTDPAAVAAP